MTLEFEIVVDKGETPNKCTILPLADRADFLIMRPARSEPIPTLTGDLLLHPDGELLSQIKGLNVKRLSVIDSNWKWLPLLMGRVQPPVPRLARIPAGFKTAYPRRSKKNTDPEEGLATIEAVFIAAAFLGHWDETLFAKYHFGAEFLAMNQDTFHRYGVFPQA
jgi:pre-rRNA-processing protein TSR3